MDTVLTKDRIKAEKRLRHALKWGSKDAVKEAFAAFYEATRRLVYRIVIDKIGRTEHTDDDVSEAFVVLMSHPEKIPGIKNLALYVAGTAVSLSIANCRRESTPPEEYVDEAVAAQAPSSSESLDRWEIEDKVRATLGEKDAEIVVLAAGYDYSFKEIAGRLGLGEDAVYYRYKKTMKKLKKALKQ